MYSSVRVIFRYETMGIFLGGVGRASMKFSFDKWRGFSQCSVSVIV